MQLIDALKPENIGLIKAEKNITRPFAIFFFVLYFSFLQNKFFTYAMDIIVYLLL